MDKQEPETQQLSNLEKKSEKKCIQVVSYSKCNYLTWFIDSILEELYHILFSQYGSGYSLGVAFPTNTK